jgi:RNA polymerase sigma-70 factor (ECF subfamily)
MVNEAYGTETEAEIRRRFDLGDLGGAATVALRAYGPELFGFLMAFLRDETSASEAFSEATERMWKGFPTFGWDASFRTWAYVITRRAALSYQRDGQRRARRNRPLPEGSALSGVAADVRSATLTYLRTETKTRAAELRESLSHEDQEILVLRIDKGLEWAELSRVLYDGEGVPDAAEIKRESARLRKRFQVAKRRLLELARREGLVGQGEE